MKFSNQLYTARIKDTANFVINSPSFTTILYGWCRNEKDLCCAGLIKEFFQDATSNIWKTYYKNIYKTFC